MPALQESIDAVRVAARAANDVKAMDVVAFDVSQPIAITDIFMVATGSNERQVLAIAEEVEKQLHLQKNLDPRSREGVQEAQWVLLDCPQIDLQLEHPFTLKDDDPDGQLASKADDLNGDDLRSRFVDPQENHD